MLSLSRVGSVRARAAREERRAPAERAAFLDPPSSPYIGLPGGAYRHRLITPSIPDPGTDESILRVPLYERKGNTVDTDNRDGACLHP